VRWKLAATDLSENEVSALTDNISAENSLRLISKAQNLIGLYGGAGRACDALS
jgi:hypothetical protein